MFNTCWAQANNYEVYLKALIQQTNVYRAQTSKKKNSQLHFDVKEKKRDETRTASVSEKLRTKSTDMSHRKITSSPDIVT